MVFTRSWAGGLTVAAHAQEELSVAPVHAPIPLLQTEEETAVDLLQNLENAIDTTAQLKK